MWAVVGQVLATVLATAVLGLVAFLWRSRRRVVAKVLYGRMRMPDAILERFDPDRVTPREEYYQAFAGPTFPEDQQRWADRAATIMVARDREQRKKDRLYSSLTGACFITVMNGRPKPAADVWLRLPKRTVLVRTVREDGDTKEHPSVPRLALGVLQPHEQVQVIAWGSYEPDPQLDLAQIHVGDAEGEGVVRTKVLVSPIWGVIAEAWWFLLPLAVLLLAMMLNSLQPKRALPPQSSPHVEETPSSAASPRPK